MAITHSAAVRSAIANAVVDLLDAGSTNPNGQLVLETAGAVEVATLNLSNPAFGNASNGVATAAAISNDDNATGGTVAQFKLVDRDGTTVITGTVTAIGGGGDIELSSTSIAPTESVAISSITYTAAS